MRKLPSECRPRIYRALGRGTVPLDAVARADLRASIAREAASIRKTASEALRRGATDEELELDRAVGPPEVRAAAFSTLLARASRARAEELAAKGDRALADEEAVVRLEALHVLATAAWIRHPRVGDWAMTRLLDKDRAVRHEALRLLRRFPINVRQLPRLRLIVEDAPPGIRPVLQRLLEHHERRAR